MTFACAWNVFWFILELNGREKNAEIGGHARNFRSFKNTWETFDCTIEGFRKNEDYKIDIGLRRRKGYNGWSRGIQVEINIGWMIHKDIEKHDIKLFRSRKKTNGMSCPWKRLINRNMVQKKDMVWYKRHQMVQKYQNWNYFIVFDYQNSILPQSLQWHAWEHKFVSI